MNLDPKTLAYLVQLFNAANQTSEAQAFQSALNMALLSLGLDITTPGRWNVDIATGIVTENAVPGIPGPRVEEINLWKLPRN